MYIYLKYALWFHSIVLVCETKSAINVCRLIAAWNENNKIVVPRYGFTWKTFSETTTILISTFNDDGDILGERYKSANHPPPTNLQLCHCYDKNTNALCWLLILIRVDEVMFETKERVYPPTTHWFLKIYCFYVLKCMLDLISDIGQFSNHNFFFLNSPVLFDNNFNHKWYCGNGLTIAHPSLLVHISIHSCWNRDSSVTILL